MRRAPKHYAGLDRVEAVRPAAVENDRAGGGGVHDAHAGEVDHRRKLFH